ncbi:anaphase-promoting complex subunit 11 [Rhododendron vialii]|uniref:anaphase-promoting complex subunit 11 n=1 Tax=Rhododendron vialii TaxID=182163 RepID=UPI00265F7B62|nr:anaphase-promoting complex subunit 11 [Rhododendron vialii]
MDFLLKTRSHLKVASKRVWGAGKSFVLESRGFLILCNIYIIQLKKCIRRWHAVASWTWDAQDETCGICRMAFDGCCPDCKLPGDNCPLIWGACNHAFHLHCILKWVTSQTPQAHCPMCRREWQFKGDDQTD